MTEELANTTGESTATATAAAVENKSNRLVLQGKVVSDKMAKTIVVEVEYLKKHRLYKKAIRRHNRFKAHDENNTSRVGDIVRIEECRPISKEKTWRLVEIVQKGVVL
ncbi:MAG: ribosomal protein [Chloroflexi bacterium]|jgi:small subunit ribosomal protein S17|nr:ribosomal protein [Chloroflexota bacterium]